MKIILLIIGIVSLIACVLFLLFAAFSLYGYYHVLDGTSEQFIRLSRRMRLLFVIGIVLAVIGSVCFIICSKM